MYIAQVIIDGILQTYVVNVINVNMALFDIRLARIEKISDVWSKMQYEKSNTHGPIWKSISWEYATRWFVFDSKL